jgi:glutaredoxin
MAGFVDDIQGDLQMRWKIFQDSKDDDLKQKIANVMAGEYDATAAGEELDALIASAPCVMFTWENSPSCKQAVAALGTASATVKIVRLDDPWATGNVLRAALGKRVGRSSVPAVFLDGTYIGGYDGGVGDDAPGILHMAFAGTLRPRLEAIGALDTDNKSD